MEDRHREIERAAVAVGIAVQLVFAFLVLSGLSAAAAQSPATSVEPTLGPRAWLVGAVFVAPAGLGALGLWGRPALLAAAALVSCTMVLIPISVASFVQILPGTLYLMAAALRVDGRGAGRGRPAAWLVRGLVLGVLVTLVLGFGAVLVGGFLALWAVVGLAALVAMAAAVAVIFWDATAESTRRRAAWVAAGSLLAALLSLVVFTLPMFDTTTVCWQRSGSASSTERISARRAAELGRPAGAASWSAGSGSESGLASGVGCDGTVPTATSEWVAAVAFAATIVIAIGVMSSGSGMPRSRASA